MKKFYTSLSEATHDLKARGYTHDFNLKPHCIECTGLQLELSPEKFTVVSFIASKGCPAQMTIALSLLSLLLKELKVCW